MVFNIPSCWPTSSDSGYHAQLVVSFSFPPANSQPHFDMIKKKTACACRPINDKDGLTPIEGVHDTEMLLSPFMLSVVGNHVLLTIAAIRGKDE